MQSNPDLLDALRTDLAELTALHAPSGAEQAVMRACASSSPPWSMRLASIPWAISARRARGRQVLRMSWSRPMLMRSGRSSKHRT